MEACVKVAAKLAETGVTSAEEQLAGCSACTALWNMCMDAAGKVKCCPETAPGGPAKAVPLVRTLGFLLSVVLATPKQGQFFRLKAAIAGALGAAAIHVPVKPQLLEQLAGAMALPAARAELWVMHRHATTLGRLLVLLQECNDEYAPLFELKKTNQLKPGQQASRFDELCAAIKNTVQCIRIVAELPAARQELLPFLVPEGPAPAPLVSGPALMLRRQIFYSTDFAEVFRVPPV